MDNPLGAAGRHRTRSPRGPTQHDRKADGADMSQFDDAISERIDDLDRQLRAALVQDGCADIARIESELSDLERLQREHC